MKPLSIMYNHLFVRWCYDLEESLLLSFVLPRIIPAEPAKTTIGAKIRKIPKSMPESLLIPPKITPTAMAITIEIMSCFLIHDHSSANISLSFA